MASSYQPITIPLLEGIRQDQSFMAGSRPRLHYAQNIDYSIAGQLQGRLGWTQRSDTFQRRTINNASPGPTTSAVDIADLPFTFQSLFRYRDTDGERPGAYAFGRVWTKEDSHWADRLYCGSAKTDRLIEYSQRGTIGTALSQMSSGYNFIQGMSQIGVTLLGGATPSVDTYVTGIVAGASQELFGGACDVVSGTDTYHCQVGNTGNDNVLRLVVRKNNDLAVSTFTINVAANDCETASATTRAMDPKCCSDLNSASAGGTACFWVAYKENGAANIKIARVNPITGAILASATHAIANPIGFWISSDAADNRVYGCFTQTAVTSLLCKSFNATTLADLALNATMSSSGLTVEGPCVIGGGVSTGRKPYVAFTFFASGGVANTATDVRIGFYDTSGPSTTILKTYFGAVAAAGIPEHTWTIMHQPILMGTMGDKARTVMGLVWGTGAKVNATQTGATWFSIDLTDMVSSTAGATVLGRQHPGILAKCQNRITTLPFGAVHAVPGPADSASFVSNYRFSSVNYTQFSTAGALTTWIGLNQVTLITPKVATMGEQTVLSGSVPHMIARGYSCEVGFPLGAPEIECTATAGAGIAAGSYTLQACWKWVDEAGVIHRSGFSTAKTVATSGGNLQITVRAIQAQLTEREFGSLFSTNLDKLSIEVYSTGINPSTNALRFFQTSTIETDGIANSTIVLSSISTTTEPQYTSGGVFQNSHVSADGGVAVVGRRMWLSNGKSVFASKLYTPGRIAPAWNDEGILQVNVPAPAGKVVSLENFGDKLVILCERGILVSYGDGPDDTGVGPSFVFPVSVSPLGLSSELGSVSTPHGVVFHSNNTIDNQFGNSILTGGLFLFDGSMKVQPIGVSVNKHLKAGPAQLSYLPERETLLVNNYNVTGLIDAVPNILALDMRSGNWSVWTNPNGIPDLVNIPGVCFGLTEAAGVLYGGFLEGNSGGMLIASLDRTDGKDDNPGETDQNIKMALLTNNIYADTQQALGWARVRSVSVMGDVNLSTPAHTLTVSVTPDRFGNTMTQSFVYTSIVSNGHLAPEFRLPRQKMSQIIVQLEATPAVASWAALRFDVLPLNILAPAQNRG